MSIRSLTQRCRPVNHHGSGHIIDHLKIFFQKGLDIKVSASIYLRTPYFSLWVVKKTAILNENIIRVGRDLSTGKKLIRGEK